MNSGPGKQRFLHKENIKLFLLYFLLIAGGMWHLMDWFQGLMRLLAGPLLMALAILLLVELFRVVGWRGLIFSAVVLVSSHFIEWYGVESGRIFGRYAYGAIMQPQLAGVPVAIGFAWLILLWSSAALSQRILPDRRAASALVMIVATAVLMVGFDRIMEPAAMKLGYWTWQDGVIPLQNYLAWFVISVVYALAGWRLKLFKARLPRLAAHVYGAQMLYFLLVWVS